MERKGPKSHHFDRKGENIITFISKDNLGLRGPGVFYVVEMGRPCLSGYAVPNSVPYALSAPAIPQFSGLFNIEGGARRFVVSHHEGGIEHSGHATSAVNRRKPPFGYGGRVCRSAKMCPVLR